MKRLFVLSALLAVLLSSAALGAVKDFGEFTLDIPEGWTAEMFEEDTDPGIYTVNIEKDDKSCIMSFTYGKTDVNAIEDLVADWANMEQDSSEPQLTNDGYYMYTYTNGDGKKSTVYARSESDGEMYIVAEMAGNDTQTMTAIRDSFALKGTAKTPSEPAPEIEQDEPAPKQTKPKTRTEKRYYNDNTELILAAVKGQTDTVTALINAGSDVNAKNIYGMTALMYAAEGNHADTAEALLEGGADIDATNNEGSTSLMIAAIHACEDAANILIDAGADVKATNNDGKTALDYARENGNLRGSRLLKRLERLSK